VVRSETLFVFRQVRVQQINGDAPDIYAPDLEGHQIQADLDGADQPPALGVQQRFERDVVRVNRIVVFRLPVVGINRLLEITFAVKQADADKTETEVAGGFRVVAGQDAEAAGGNRQRFVKAEFGGEISDGIFVQFGGVRVTPGFLVAQIIVKVAQDRADAGGEVHILQAGAKFLLGNFAQHGHGVVKHVLPAARREFVEEVLGLLVPAPPKVAGKFVQTRHQFIEFCARERFIHGIIC
jgi:hypothetical protein